MELYRRAKSLLSTKKFEESHELLTELVNKCTTDSSYMLSSGLTVHELADIYNCRGHIKYLWVDFDGAIQDYTQAISHDPLFAVAYYNRGQIHYRMGRYNQAEVDLLEALRIQPDFPDATLNLQQVQLDIASGRKFNV